ncbi:MAG: hypothetical protein ACD_49C00060G0035 [uncultured bacterium (gcode 4)]|uniref:SIS domain-containing protein n=1 Tax=uncultured bacterium (gcode 4) TaxID=1234023 RepID=K2BBR0_9BACT|nr:MAG: hypothetical protein ACD_49C00060G0035 [uncultured bacterium (gcode 4)]
MPYNKKTFEQKLNHSTEYLDWLKSMLDSLDKNDIAKIIDIIEQSFLDWKKIFIAWNGWSAATASHMVSDLQKTTLWKKPQDKNDLIKFKAISLSDNIPVMTAWGNDEGYEYIFSEQLKVLADRWDLLIVITWSGNSSNILKIAEEANKLWVKTLWFLWFNWGRVKDLVDDYIIVKSDNFWFIEDIHMILDHLITAYFKSNIS